MGDRVTADIGFGHCPASERIGEDAKFFEQIATQVSALMTGDAAIGLEELIAALLVGGDRVRRTAQIIVEGRIGCEQRSLKGR
jgi:hypothetical protein